MGLTVVQAEKYSPVDTRAILINHSFELSLSHADQPAGPLMPLRRFSNKRQYSVYKPANVPNTQPGLKGSI